MLVMLLKSEGFTNINCAVSKAYQAETMTEKIGINKSHVFLVTNSDSVTVFKGAAISFECVGKNETLNAVINHTLPGGKIMLVGNPASDMTLPRDAYWKILRNQLTVKGTWNSSFTKEEKDDWHYILSKLSKHEIPADILISHKFSLEELQKGFELMRDKSENYIKCMYVL